MGLIKRALKLTNENIVLVCLLAFFSLATSVFLSLFKAINSHVIVLSILISVAFFAGLFNLITNILQQKTGKLCFLEGVGDYFLPMLGVGLISLGTYLSSGVIAMFSIINLLGIKEQVNSAIAELLPVIQAGTTESFAKISPETAKVYIIIMLSVWFVWGVLSLIILYWVPVIFISNERNIFKALWLGIKFLGKNLWKTLGVFVITIAITTLISIVSVLVATISPLLESIFILLTYYVGIIFLFTVFLLYKEN